MISFACKEFEMDKIVKCALGVPKADFRVLQLMMKHVKVEYNTERLGKELRLTLSTVQRAVKRLHEKEVIERHQKNFKGGGYEFIYKVSDKTVVRKQIMKVINGWFKGLEDSLNEWP